MSEKKKAGGLEAFADRHTQAAFAENQEIARTNRALRSELAKAKEELVGANADVVAAHRELDLLRADYSDRPDWLKTPRSSKEDRGTLIAMLSDTHYGEVVNPREMGGFNKYNLKIAELRTERFFRRTIVCARTYLAGVKYDGLVLALNGDIVSGDIHDELTETNEASTYETVLWAVPRIAAGVEMFAKEFERVHVVSAPGNHGRNAIKPRYKKRSANNADTLIARLVARELGTDKRVSFEIPESLDVGFQVYGSRFTMEHGDELNAFQGSAEIGPLGPLVRGTNRKAIASAAEGRPFDYALWSHLHKLLPVAASGFVGNGSVKGYDEYARGKKFKPERPQQALLVCTPEYGITTDMPVFVVDRKAEGW